MTVGCRRATCLSAPADPLEGTGKMNKAIILTGLTALGALSVGAESIIINLGNSANHSELNTQALGVGLNATDYSGLDGTSSSVTLAYDISGQGIGAADTLEVAVTGSADLTSGGAWGLSVEGTGDGSGNNLWYDVGETLSFVFTIKDSEGVDITSDLDYFGFTGFSAKGLNRNLNGLGDPVTVGMAGQNLNLGGGNTYHEKTGFNIDLSSTPTAYKLNSARSGQNDITQLGQLQFEVIPEPATMGLISAIGGGILFIRRWFVI